VFGILEYQYASFLNVRAAQLTFLYLRLNSTKSPMKESWLIYTPRNAYTFIYDWTVPRANIYIYDL